MKKLLSVFAAAAMLFGFASCSGDLHDAQIIDLTGYGIRGTMTGWAEADDIPLVDNGDGTYSISFAAQDPDGTGLEKIAVIELGDGSWNTAYRLAQPKSEGDSANVFGEADGWEQKVYQGQSADCMLIPAAKGDNVTLLITPSTTYITVKVTVKAGAAPVVPADPVPYVLSGMFVRGGMFDSSWGAVLAGALMDFTTSTKGEVEYQLDFVGAGGDMGFKVASANWDDGYSGAEITVNADYVPFTQMRVGGKVTDMEGNPIPDPGKPGENLGDTGNSTIKATKAGANYRMYIKTNPDKEVFVKVEQIAAVTYKFKVINLSDDNVQAWINGSFWGGWELGWPILTWKAAIKQGYAPVAVVDGVADFPEVFNVSTVAKVGETKSFNFKVVACSTEQLPAEGMYWNIADGENPNWTSGDADLSLEHEITGDGTYVVVVDAETCEVTIE